MSMYNPPHPGEFIKDTYIKPYDLSVRFLAAKLDVAPSTLNRLIKCQSGVSPEMAMRLSKSLGRSAESWLSMQDAYDLWQARKKINLRRVQKVHLESA